MNGLMAVTAVAFVLIAVGGWQHRPRRVGRGLGVVRHRFGRFPWRSGGVRRCERVRGRSHSDPDRVRCGRPPGGWMTVPAWVFPVVSGMVGAAVWFPWGVLGAGAWPALRRIRQARQRRRCDRVWQEGIDVLVTLMGLGLGGGASVRRAMADALPWVGGDVGRTLSVVLARVDRGASLADELETMVAAARPQLAGLARVVAATERYGAPAVSELEALALERRLDERQRLERVARRVPVQLLVPLVCGVLPAFVLLSVVPMLAGALGNLRALAP